ncbi:transglycosylase SLT domain-containing protein [Streptomyces sp. NPDC059009]|uniref:transglycosylase SLT domain-containing protein n=1 Tax=Streptomyces sp. NPDC059009 TaxID=3346694 RepID=UPI0036BEF8B1
MATITSLSFVITSSYDGAGMRRARRDINSFGSSTKTLHSILTPFNSQLKIMSSLALGLGPALLPAASAVGALAGGLAAATTAAGAAAGIFGGALAGAIASTNSATKAAQQQLDRQKAVLSGLTPGTKAYAEQLKKVHEAEKNLRTVIQGLSPAQQKYIASVSAMKSGWSSFIKATAKDTLTPTSIVLNAIGRNFDKLIPVVKAVSPLITNLAKDFAGWLDGPGLDRFITAVEKHGVPALHNFIETGRDVLAVLGKGFRDFLPLGDQIVRKLADGAETLRGWAEGGGFERFINKVVDNAPALKDIFKSLIVILGNVAGSMEDTSEASITIVGVLTDLLTLLSPELITAITYAWLGWNLALEAYALYCTAAAAASVILATATSPFLLLMAGAALTVLGVVAALAALAAAIYFLVKNWDTVWGAIKATWDFVWNWIKTTAVTIWGFLSDGWGQFLLLLMGPIGILVLIGLHWKQIWEAMQVAAQVVWSALKTGWSAFTSWLSSTWNSIWGGLLTAWHGFIDPIVQSWNQVWPELKLAAQNVWNFLSIAWAALWQGASVAWGVFWGNFGPIFTAAWNGAVANAKAAWGLLTAAWDLLWTTVLAIYHIGWALLSGSWQIGWTWLTGAARIAWSIFTGAWSVLWTTITGIWNVFYATFRAIFAGAWNVIVALATGIWNVVRAGWDALWKVVTAIFLTFTAIFTGHWGKAWTAIKDAALAIWNLIKAAWQAFVNTILAIFNAWVGVFVAAFRALWLAIQAIAMAAWNAFRASFQVFLSALQNLWNTTWNAVRNFFQAIVNSVAAIAQAGWNLIRAGVQALLTYVLSLWNTTWTTIRTLFQVAVNAVVAGALAFWNSIRTAFSAGSTWLRETFWNPVNNFFTKTIPEAFKKGADALGKAWDSIRNLVRKPIQAVVDIVYNKGIVALWNRVAKVFHADELHEFTLPAFAKGGPTGSGSSKGFPAIVHPGEHVWTSAEVKALGGHEEVAKLRAMALGRGPGSVRVMGGPNGRFDGGGGILGTGWGPDTGPDLVPDGIVKNAVGKLKDLALGGVSKILFPALDAMLKGAKAVIRGIVPGSDTPMEQLATGIPQRMVDVVKAWVKDKDVAPISLGRGGKMVGAIPKGDHLRIINAALKAAGVPPPGTLSQWQKGLNTLITRESGWNPNAINNWDSNAAAGMASRGLAQVIPPTFAANHVPGTSSNIFDPVANVAAAIRYITRRYGNITNVAQADASAMPQGYALGTPGARSGWGIVGEYEPELVRFRGGERVDPLRELIGGSRRDVHVEVHIPISGRVDHGVVDRLERQTIPRLTMAIKQGVGRRS